MPSNGGTAVGGVYTQAWDSGLLAVLMNRAVHCRQTDSMPLNRLCQSRVLMCPYL
jgi:hypothetical protein